MNREVGFYETVNGNTPVFKFIHSLDRRDQAKVVSTFKYITGSETVPSSMLKKMVGTPGLWEIRVKGLSGIFRFLCFFDGSRLIVVLSGFQKKTQKTPKREIETAIKRKNDYLKQKRGKK